MANAQTPIPNYKTSWIANDGGKPEDHIMHNVDNMFVTPDGTAYCGTGWEEGGANVSIFKDGRIVGIPSNTLGWGRASHSVVTADQQHLYHLMGQSGCDGGHPSLNQNGLRQYPDCIDGAYWQAVRRFDKDGNPAPFSEGYGFDGTMLLVNIGGEAPVGIAVSDTEIFVADPTENSVKVYNKMAMEGTPVREFTMARVGLLSFDTEGFLWMLQKATALLPAKLIRFSAIDGSVQPQEITLPPSLVPTSFCVDKLNRILVTDNGIDQNIKIYQDITVSPNLSGTFGNTGGIYSGRPGEVGPLKFNKPTGVGTDDLGNIYVASTSYLMGGTSIESYSPTGEQNWKLRGLAFVSTADLDNETQVDAYDHDKHYKLDFSQDVAGKEWEYAGYTLNRFKYPDDLRLHDFPSPGFIRTIAGKKFLYTSNMYGNILGVYRFNEATDGEIAIPSLFFTGGWNSNYGGWPIAYPVNKEFIWRDQDGDGGIQANEYDAKDPDTYEEVVAWGVDDNGGIWKGARREGLRYFPLQGIDSNGVPIYNYASSVKYPLPEGTDGVRRIWYDASADELFLTGFSDTIPNTANDWGALGSTICKYSNWSQGNRTPNLILYIPYSPGDNKNAKAFCVEGDYIFVMRSKEGKIAVYNRSDGSIAGMISPGAEVGFKSGWTDINIAITARKRANGEYVIFAEEDGYAKIMMYRWSGIVPPEAFCPGSGSILREQWNNVGLTIESIPTSTPPDSTLLLEVFESPSNAGDNYGSRIRGYVCPPYSGNYTFWIAGDDTSELYLSSDQDPVNKTRIAFVDSWTDVREWDKFSSQKSAPVHLEAGQKYYIEAMQLDSGGPDNLAVGWQWESSSFEEKPINGSRLSPFEDTPFTTRSNVENSITIFPNPSNGNYNLRIKNNETGNYVITIFDMMGIKVMQDNIYKEAGTSQNIINVSGVPNGIYYVEIQSIHSTIIKKIVKL